MGPLNSKVDGRLTGVKVKNSITVTHVLEVFSVIMFLWLLFQERNKKSVRLD